MGANTSSHTHEPLGGAAVAGGIPPQPVPAPTMSRTKSFRKSLRRSKKRRRQEEQVDNKAEGTGGRRMDRLRRSFRDSFRKKKDPHLPEASKPHQWQTDEESVKNGTCNFLVKYLGCVEVFESRGMQVCEEALKVLRNSRRRPLRGILYISGDGLRVVDDETKGLIVDQTIEKVSFCAPDRNHERGFSYICRDGTTRRWMCHGFIAVKETGERLSHAVGCAFASCLERKQKRDKECGVTMSFDTTNSTFTRVGSFKQMSLTERISDPQDCKPSMEPPVKKVDNPHAIARPHATPLMLQRQGSFRVFQHLNQSSPFKRQLSLRLSDLPSNLERTRSMSLDNSVTFDDTNSSSTLNNNHINDQQPDSPPHVIPRTPRNRLHSLPNVNMTPIPEISPIVETKGDPVSAMCKELSAGLTLLTNISDPFSGSAINAGFSATSHTNHGLASPTDMLIPDVDPIRETNPWSGAPTVISRNTLSHSTAAVESNSVGQMSKGEEWLAQLKADNLITNGISESSKSTVSGSTNGTTTTSSATRNPPLAQLRSSSLGTSAAPSLRGAGSNWISINGDSTGGSNLNNVNNHHRPNDSNPHHHRPGDPFDAEWAALAGPPNPNPNNPFLQNTVVTKAFEVQM